SSCSARCRGRSGCRPGPTVGRRRSCPSHFLQVECLGLARPGTTGSVGPVVRERASSARIASGFLLLRLTEREGGYAPAAGRLARQNASAAPSEAHRVETAAKRTERPRVPWPPAHGLGAQRDMGTDATAAPINLSASDFFLMQPLSEERDGVRFNQVGFDQPMGPSVEACSSRRGGLRPRAYSTGSGRADPEHLALEGTPLILAQAAPDAGVLTGFECPVQAVGGNGTTPADGLGLFDLTLSRSGGPDREKELGVLVTAERSVAPVHASYSLGRSGRHCTLRRLAGPSGCVAT